MRISHALTRAYAPCALIRTLPNKSNELHNDTESSGTVITSILRIYREDEVSERLQFSTLLEN